MKRHTKLRVLVLCHDVVGSSMAGPGIRYQNIARTLGQHFDVKLGVFSEKNRGSSDVMVVEPKGNSFQRFIDEADIIFAQWLSEPMINYAGRNGKIIIFDLYAPVPIEYLAALEFSDKAVTKHQRLEFEAIVEMYKNYLSIGQYFTCSNERQRDFWSGFLVGGGLYNIDTFRQQKIRGRFLICPMGIDPSLPKAKSLKLRSSVKGISKDDFVLLWTGGIWDWFDAQLIVRSMAEINDKKIKLVFLGTKHPNEIYEEASSETAAAYKLAKDLGLLDKSVFFLEGWVPYTERAAYMLDADVAIYADKESLETRLSHRTRVLDHIWSGLPTICPSGDYLSEVIGHRNLGLVVGSRDSQKFAKAIKKLKDDKALYKRIKRNLADERSSFTWDKTLEPLINVLNNINLAEQKSTAKASHAKALKAKRLPLKRRVRRSAKMLLLGK